MVYSGASIQPTLSDNQRSLLDDILEHYGKNETSITDIEISNYCSEYDIEDIHKMALYSYLYGIFENMLASSSHDIERNYASIMMGLYDDCIMEIEHAIEQLRY